MQSVAILGVGRTDYEAKPGIAIPELVHWAVQDALTDAGITHAEIDAVVTASVDLYDGLTASNVAVTEVVGAVMKPETRIAGDGLLAVCQGAMSILAGAYKTVLAVAHCKASMGDLWGISNWTFDPIFQQPLGLDDRVAAGLQASMLPAAPPRTDAMSLPKRQPVADGAAAVILSSAQSPITIRGMGWALEEHLLGDRALCKAPALREAARQAYGQAGITNPESELSLVEISDHFDHQRTLWTSELGLSDFPHINLSAGLERGVPPFVAGLDRLIEVVLRLRSKPGLGLAHGCWGPAGQGQVVVVAEYQIGWGE